MWGFRLFVVKLCYNLCICYVLLSSVTISVSVMYATESLLCFRHITEENLLHNLKCFSTRCHANDSKKATSSISVGKCYSKLPYGHDSVRSKTAHPTYHYICIYTSAPQYRYRPASHTQSGLEHVVSQANNLCNHNHSTSILGGFTNLIHILW